MNEEIRKTIEKYKNNPISYIEDFGIKLTLFQKIRLLLFHPRGKRILLSPYDDYCNLRGKDS